MKRNEHSAGRFPCLRLDTAGGEPEIFPLAGALVTLGGSPDCEIQIAGPPRQQAFILYHGGEYQLKPLGKSGEVKINGNVITREATLIHGNKLSVNGRELMYLEKPLLDADVTPPADSIDGFAGHEKIYTRLFQAIHHLLKEKNPEQVLRSLVVSVAQILKCDGVNLVQDENGLWRSLAIFPENASAKRFSVTAIERAREEGKTILLSRAELDNLPMGESIQFNEIISILCSPLPMEESDSPGFLYMDRLSCSEPFNSHDRDFFDSLRGMFSELIRTTRIIQAQKSTIAFLQAQEGNKGGAVFESDVMEQLYLEAGKVARTTVPVLISGDTGTGKELVAKFIHQQSSRAQQPFVAVNCGAIPPNLMESELFGHVKGAFTGADRDKPGIMESANTGTLFMDEVGELPLDLQVKLLRVLQEGEVRRVGSTAASKVDFRLVSATHRNLEKDSEDGRFRPDLFFRLNVITLKVPPLRERKEDIKLLAAHFIKSFCSQYGMSVKVLSKPAENAMTAHLWPGNVRELENKLHKAVILTGGRVIHPADLGMESIHINDKERDESGWSTLKSAMESTRKKTIEKCLERTGGNISRAASLLDINRRVLTRFISQHGINPKAFKT